MRPSGGAICSLRYSAPSAVRYVACTNVGLGFGLATRMKVSKIVVAPSASVHAGASVITPLALWAPEFEAPGKYMVRSTTIGAGVVVPAATARMRAEALPFSPNSCPSRTVSRDVPARR